MTVEIRGASLADDSELARIDHESWAPSNSPSPLWERARPFFGAPTGTVVADVLVAEENAIIVGYVKLSTPIASRCTIRLSGLAVDIDARGRGIGLQLVEAAMGIARGRGFRFVDLKVLGTNTPALRTYRQAGFRECECTPGRFTIDGRLVDDITLIAAV